MDIINNFLGKLFSYLQEMIKICTLVISDCPGPRFFRSGHHNPLSFSSPLAYISLDHWLQLGEGNFECMLKTNGSDGIILYNAGLVRYQSKFSSDGERYFHFCSVGLRKSCH